MSQELVGTPAASGQPSRVAERGSPNLRGGVVLGTSACRALQAQAHVALNLENRLLAGVDHSVAVDARYTVIPLLCGHGEALPCSGRASGSGVVQREGYARRIPVEFVIKAFSTRASFAEKGALSQLGCASHACSRVRGGSGGCESACQAACASSAAICHILVERHSS